MRNHLKLAIAVGMLALSALPAMALASEGPVYTPEPPSHGPKGPKGELPSHAKAYGLYCRGKSKKHVKGETGTEFSRCVHAIKTAANNEDKTAREACKGLSKKHVRGEKGTEFSRCIVAVAHLRRDEQQEGGATTSVASANGVAHKHVPPQAQTPEVTTPTGPQYEPTGEPPHGHAYGYYCQGASKKHVKGEKGTPFSQCVHAMKQAANNESKTAREACKQLSKKHVKGEKGTEFSRCIVAVAHLRHDEQQEGTTSTS